MVLPNMNGNIGIVNDFLQIGVFDIDDIILNVAGAIAGYLFVHIRSINLILKKAQIYQ